MADVPEKPRIWAWPSQEILDGLDLRERRRQYLIMAHEARGKAGPMRDDGTHARPEWIERSKNFEAEARRLSDRKADMAQYHSDPDEPRHRNPFRRAPVDAVTPAQAAPDDEVI